MASEAHEFAAEAELRADMNSIKGDMNDIKSSMRQIADAMTKLAILEDRQSAAANIQTKVLERIETLEARQHATELRLATGNLTLDQITAVAKKVDGVHERMVTLEAQKRAAGAGIKALWAVFGSALTAGIVWLISGGKGI